MPGGGLSAHRGALLHFLSDPGEHDAAAAYEYFDDGLLLVGDGAVQRIRPAKELLPQLPAGTPLTEHDDALLLPGFIDTHIHCPQTDMIASGGRQLLDWLADYTFPTEARFADYAHGREVAEFFLDELLRNGTTTAQVFGSVHAASVDSFFDAAQARGLRMIAGKALMDRNCPEYLRDTAESGERETRELIERWHGRGRLHYAITPRFAPTSTEAQLASAGRLARAHPDVYIHTHLAENRAELDWVKALFPWSATYLDVYERHGLLRERATFAHCIHLDDADRRRLGACGACAAFSPSSNLYLGSGLFDLAASDAAGLRYGLATDVGGGTSFSALRTMGEAYKVAQMQGQHLPPLRAFYLATLGGARALHLHDRIGSFRAGNEADFIVLDLAATPLLRRRLGAARSLAEKLLVLMMLGDDRAVRQVYIRGTRTGSA
ncbi:MAG: guanine deaminase [Panacagrimonas sp.]